jgi:hypothetical protein
VAERYADAAPNWRRQALLVEQTTSADSRELGTFLHNMVELSLMPAGFLTEARETLLRAKQIYTDHREVDGLSQVDELLHKLSA